MKKVESPTFTRQDLESMSSGVYASNIIQEKWAKTETVPEKHRLEYLQILQEFLDFVRIMGLFYDKGTLSQLKYYDEDFIESCRMKMLDVINDLRSRRGLEPCPVEEVPAVFIDDLENLPYEEKIAIQEIMETTPRPTIIF